MNPQKPPNVSFIMRHLITRVSLFLSSIVYVVALNYAHAIYLNPEHAIWGFPYHALDFLAWIYVIISVGLTTTFIPISFRRPSGLILFISFVLIYLPSVIITLALRDDAIDRYGLILHTLTIGFSVVCVFVECWKPDSSKKKGEVLGEGFFLTFFVFWLISFILLVTIYKDVINFVGIEEMYAQREAGRSKNLFEGYLQLYFSYVFSPALLSICLLKKKLIFVFISFLGFILSYSITAERTVFVMPFVIVVIYFALSSRTLHAKQMIIVLLGLSVVVFATSLFYDTLELFKFLGLYVVFRVIALPGAFLAQYHDVFTTTGYTFWSHVSGVSNFINVPANYISYPDWPQLGYIVAEHVLGMRSNSNANFFAYDGVAAGGPLGILVICGVLATFLGLLDRAANGLNQRLIVLLCVPIAFALTNVSLFSVMLSFGGLFWILVFYIKKFSRLRMHTRSAIAPRASPISDSEP